VESRDSKIYELMRRQPAISAAFAYALTVRTLNSTCICSICSILQKLSYQSTRRSCSSTGVLSVHMQR
jgi:hypothetical protein